VNIHGQLYFIRLENKKGQHTRDRVMVFNVTFNNSSVISWGPVLLVEETGVPRENHARVHMFEYLLFFCRGIS
jgi:DNA-directed RNA polymerase beta' subunit